MSHPATGPHAPPTANPRFALCMAQLQQVADSLQDEIDRRHQLGRRDAPGCTARHDAAVAEYRRVQAMAAEPADPIPPAHSVARRVACLVAAVVAVAWLAGCGGGSEPEPGQTWTQAAPSVGAPAVVVLTATGTPTIGAFLPIPAHGAASAPGPVGDDGGE